MIGYLKYKASAGYAYRIAGVGLPKGKTLHMPYIYIYVFHIQPYTTPWQASYSSSTDSVPFNSPGEVAFKSNFARNQTRVPSLSHLRVPKKSGVQLRTPNRRSTILRGHQQQGTPQCMETATPSLVGRSGSHGCKSPYARSESKSHHSRVALRVARSWECPEPLMYSIFRYVLFSA